jgi:hypothetical protein
MADNGTPTEAEDGKLRTRTLQELEAVEQQLDYAQERLAQDAERKAPPASVAKEHVALAHLRADLQAAEEATRTISLQNEQLLREAHEANTEHEATAAAMRAEIEGLHRQHAEALAEALCDAAEAAQAQAAVVQAQAQAQAKQQDGEQAAATGENTAAHMLDSELRAQLDNKSTEVDSLRAQERQSRQQAEDRIRELEAEVASVRADTARRLEAADAAHAAALASVQAQIHAGRDKDQAMATLSSEMAAAEQAAAREAERLRAQERQSRQQAEDRIRELEAEVASVRADTARRLEAADAAHAAALASARAEAGGDKDQIVAREFLHHHDGVSNVTSSVRTADSEWAAKLREVSGCLEDSKREVSTLSQSLRAATDNARQYASETEAAKVDHMKAQAEVSGLRAQLDILHEQYATALGDGKAASVVHSKLQVEMENKHQAELMALTQQWIETTDRLRQELTAVHSTLAAEKANALSLSQSMHANAAAAAAQNAQERAESELKAKQELAVAAMDRLRAEEAQRFELQSAEDRASALESEVSVLTTRAEELEVELHEVQVSQDAQQKELMELSWRAEQHEQQQQQQQQQEQQQQQQQHEQRRNDARRHVQRDRQEDQPSPIGAARPARSTGEDRRDSDGNDRCNELTLSEVPAVDPPPGLTNRATGSHTPASLYSYSPRFYSPSPITRELSERGKRNTQLLEKLKRDRAKRERERERQLGGERNGAVRGRGSTFYTSATRSLRLQPEPDTAAA